MKRKMFTFSAIVAALILLAFYLTPVVTAEDPFASRPHEWTAKQTFRSGMTVNSTNSINKAPIVFGANSTLSVAGAGTYTGVQTFSDGAYFDNEVVLQPYSGTTEMDWSYSYGNILFLSGNAASGVTLPAITSAMDGYILIVKNTSGAYTRTIIPAATVDAIETAKGTMTATTDTTINAAGEWRMWVADYTSGASGVWKLIGDGTNNLDNVVIAQKAYSHVSTAGPLTWSYAYGNVLLLSGTTPIAVALPAITAAMNGYTLTVKNVSGATTRTLTPSATLTEYIESTFATLTGTSDATIDAVGDVRTWVAVHSSTITGVSSTWMLVSERLN